MTSLISLVLLPLCLLSSPFLSNANAHTKLGFTADLIHRHSHRSPLFNPNETPSQRLKNAIHRSVNRVVHSAAKDASLNSPQAEITLDFVEYLMNVSVGTPPFPIMAIADTGSDLIWTQCKPCNDCYTQDDPLFDPKASSTYNEVSCSSRQCAAVQRDAPCSKNNKCSYSMYYGDHSNSYSKGNIATDTLTLGSTNNRPVQLKNVIIGCGHKNSGMFVKKSSGIIGLGGGAVSLISQLGDSIEGNIFIDSGTFLTFLPTTFYNQLEDAVVSSIDAKRKQDPESGFDLCFNVTADLKLPAITMHFNGGDVKLNDFNAFIRVSKELVCFAFQPSKGQAIYGNFSQMNFLIGYDTVFKTVSFKPADCAKM